MYDGSIAIIGGPTMAAALVHLLASAGRSTGFPLTRILQIVVCVSLLVAYYGYRWHRASQTSMSMKAEHDATLAWSQALLSHPAWAALHAAFTAQGYQVVAANPGPQQFELALLTFTNPTGQVVAPNDPSAIALNAYCRGPKKIAGTLWLQGGYPPNVRDAGFGEWPSAARS